MWTKTIFDDDMVPEKIKTDLTTIKACLILIQDANSDTTERAKHITNQKIQRMPSVWSWWVSCCYYYVLLLLIFLYCSSFLISRYSVLFFSYSMLSSSFLQSMWGKIEQNHNGNMNDSIKTKAAASIQELMKRPASQWLQQGSL